LPRKTYFSGILFRFFSNRGIDIADSNTESVKLPVDEELKDSRPAINDFDCSVFFFLEAFKIDRVHFLYPYGSGSFATVYRHC
jgi:hypothetical protein